jgi:F0F1-type ATP synthase membrane subunit b/b'
MIDDKNKYIDIKEEQITKLRGDMQNLAEESAHEINALRSQLSKAGTSALSRLHNIADRYDQTNVNNTTVN